VFIVYGGITVDPAKVEEVAHVAREFEKKCRAEDGCVDYILSWRITEPNRIQLVEAWETEEAALSHRAQEHVKEWKEFIEGASIGEAAFSHFAVG
jgi:quinol monooxygenase YgiN